MAAMEILTSYFTISDSFILKVAHFFQQKPKFELSMNRFILMHISSKDVLILYAGILLVCLTYIVERKSKNSLSIFNTSKSRTNM